MEFDTGGTSRGLLRSGLQPPECDAVRLVTGHAADHRLIYELLKSSPLAPSADAFSAALEEPSYEPTDRLLVKRGTQILGHVQVVHRSAWFHGVKLPVASIEGLATLPELRDAGYDPLLFSAAEQSLRGSPAVVSFAHTDRVELFRTSGWSEIAAPRHTVANVNEVLARLSAGEEAPCSLTRRERPFRIRHWRHVELEPLLEVSRQGAAATWGGLDRNEQYWRWLVGRKSHDALIVAIEGRDDWDSLAAPPHIVGYAATRGSQLVELGTRHDFHRAAGPLLARACQDAIERDHRQISLHVPPADPLHDVLVSAGGSWSTRARYGGTWLARLVDPVRWVENLYPVLLERAKSADFARPLAIGFDTGRRKYRFELTRRSGHLHLDDASPSDVTCSPSTMSALMLGNLDLDEARQTGRVFFRDDEIAARVAALFPKIAFWQSPFDAM
ncbi:MAG: GNAT family N-acetyltransferase [Pirellulales bacterium]